MAVITVGTKKQYSTLSAALNAANDGDSVLVDAGTYVNDFAVVRSKVTLTAVGGQAVLLSTVVQPAGKGILTVTTDATIDGFVFTGAQAVGGAGAGLLDTGGNLVVKNSLFVNNQNGLLVNSSAAGTVNIQSSEFARNGANDGFSHNISVGAVKSLTITDSYVHDAVGGDEIKSRAKATTITNTRIEDNASNALASVDVPNGGAVVIKNSVIEKGPASTVAAVVRNGGDTIYSGSSLSISGSTIVADRTGAVVVQNSAGSTVSLSASVVYGFTGALLMGPGTVSGNTVPVVRPAVSMAPLVVPSMALASEAGRGGAVVANGTILEVGTVGGYTSLAVALAAAKDGDTIRIAAGTYTTGSVSIDRKVIIEGYGGLARFTPGSAPSNGVAEFVTKTDVTFRNIEISGVATPGGTAAGIRSQGGNLTVVNSYIHDNQAGIVADAGVQGSVSIYDSEIARNGTPNGAGANVDVAEIGTLTLRNDWVHDALNGPEVRSRADNTTVDASRLSQAAGNGAADLELPDGGVVSVTGSVLQKGVNAQPSALLHVGGGTVHTGSSVSVSGTTFISEQLAATRFVVAEAGVSGVSVSNGVFVGGASGSVQATNARNTGATSRTGLVVASNSPWGAAGAPVAGALTAAAPVVAGPTRGLMVLRMSEDAFRGDARFTVAVDGQAVAGTLTATASHGRGQTQAFTIAGNFAAGPHSVAVTFVNDQQGGEGEDRNLYVDGLSFNGEESQQSAALMANGTALLTTAPISTLTPVTVNLSETAANGDAQAFIAIDGTVLGGLQMITASHGAGHTQGLSFLPSLAPGAHTASITFLNPADGRALFVDSIDVAGAHYASAAGMVAGGAPNTFAFTVAPPAAANTGLFVTAGAPQAWTIPL